MAHLTTYRVSRLVLIDGTILDGIWKFESDGTLGVYPRYVRDDGVIVPLHAVMIASPRSPEHGRL